MTWATVILPNMSETRAIHRCEESKGAIKWAEGKEIKDYIVVSPGYKFASLSASELDALLKQFGDTRLGMKHEDKAAVVMRMLSKYDPELHDGTGAARPGAYPETKQVVQESEDVETQTAAKKKAAPKGKKGKVLKAKPAKKREAKGDGLGREGTESRFIREAYLAGKDTAKVCELLAKKFPKSVMAKKPGQVSWYRNDMVKKGLIKKLH